MTVSVLEREMYSEAEAARLLQVSQATLNYWLEGGVRAGRTYQPVIRPKARGHRAPVTWAEFIEAGLLRQYRRERHVPMAELRGFIELLRERYSVPYPLADRRPFVNDLALVVEAQDEAELPEEFCFVGVVRNQLMLMPPAEAFVERVTWDGHLAAEWRPSANKNSPVRMNPDRRFGKPAIGGISTEAIWEHVDGGEDEDDVATDYGLDVRDVRWAIAYESVRRAS